MAGGFAQAGETLDSWRTHHVASVRFVSRESGVCVHFGLLPLMFSSNYFFFAFYFVLASDSDFFIIDKRQKNWPILRPANFCGARYRTRTCDLLHVKQMLYQLS